VPDIFISYASADRDEAARLAAFLQDKGYSIWWDRELEAGQQFDEKLDQALAECRAAIVIWTSSSIKSRWVLGEAETAAGAKKLIPVRADDLSERELPLGFRALHTIALSDRDGLLRAIKAHSVAPPRPPGWWTIFKMRLGRYLLAARRQITPARAAIAAVLVGVGAYVLLAVMDWIAIQDSLEPSDFQRHLAWYRFGPYAARAHTKLTGLEEWNRVKGSRSIAELQDYTEKYPGSLYHAFIRLRLTRLQAPATAPMLPESSRRRLTPEEINSLDCERLWTARNEIIYSLGFCFTSDAGKNAFHTRAECPYDNCKTIEKFNSWTYDIESTIQTDNIHAVRSREADQGCHLPPAPEPCASRR
jgi:hypothetical protein